MNRREFIAIEEYMLQKMMDDIHGPSHVYRVLGNAINIAKNTEELVNMDVLIASALLHDVARPIQNENTELCHAEIGSKMAYEFLKKESWAEEFCLHVYACIKTHRFRKGEMPKTIEAKILFDADKLDSIGTIGIARMLMYGGLIGEPLYELTVTGKILKTKTLSEKSTFFQEYNLKTDAGEQLFTKYASKLARNKNAIADNFYNELLIDIQDSLDSRKLLDKYIDEV